VKPFNWIVRGLVVLGLALLFIPGINLPLPDSKPKVIILIDASSSMNDKTKEKKLRDLSKIIEPLKTRFSFQVYEFADSLSNHTSLSNVKFVGTKTDIGKTLEKLDTKDAEAVLLVSDGRHNGYVDPTIKKTSIPLWTFAVGQTNLPDIGIEEVSVDDDSADHIYKNLRVRMRSNLKEPIDSKLEICSPDKFLQKVDVTLFGKPFREEGYVNFL